MNGILAALYVTFGIVGLVILVSLWPILMALGSVVYGCFSGL